MWWSWDDDDDEDGGEDGGTKFFIASPELCMKYQTNMIS